MIFPQGQTCCGQPAFNSGYVDEARSVALEQIRLFTKPIPVVLPSGSCAGMMRLHYPELFEGTPHEQAARDLADRVYELTEFLVEVCQVKLKDRGQPAKVALHTSCHARREMGVAGHHQALLEQLEQVELIPFERQRECCGFGGTFSVRHQEGSAVMVTDKTEAIEASSAERVVSGDCGCLMNMAGALEKQQSNLGTTHIATFLWERTHG